MNKFSKEIWEQNYKLDNEKIIEDTWKRISKEVAKVEKNKEKWEKEFFNILKDFKFIPGGRIIANIGRENNKSTLLNCFVAGLKNKNRDSLEGIYNLNYIFAKTLGEEGGIGTNFSFIRPNGFMIKQVGVRTPGVVSFMELFDKTADIIVRGSNKKIDKSVKNEKKKIRKGAMIGVLNCFEKFTEILTDKGWLPIYDIIERVLNGEKIYAIDEFRNKNLIINPFVKEPEELYLIETENGEKIEVTADHKFEVKNIETGEIYLKKICDIDPEKEVLKIIICK